MIIQDFPLVGFTTDGPIENSWNCTHQEGVRITLDRRGRTRLAIRESSAVYLVNGGSSDDFKRLREGNGQPTEDGAAFTIRLVTDADPGVRLEVDILEYDGDRKRIGTSKVPVQSRSIYVPPSGTSFLLFAVRAHGVGDVVIDSLVIERIPTPAGLPATRTVHSYAADGSGVDVDPQAQVDRIKGQLREIQARAARATADLDSARGALSDEGAEGAGQAVSSAALKTPQSLNRTLLIELAKTLPESDGSEYFREKLPLRAAVITDEYMLNFYKDAFEEVVYVRPDSVDDVIRNGFDLLLYVTCWKGLENEEWRGVKFRERPQAALEALLAHAAAEGIPTVFQSIEDPSNYDYFLPIAARFDHVFTSDSDRVEQYKQDLGHDRVDYLEYGANPAINNPIGTHRHSLDIAFFAGSYPKRYQDRVADMHVVLDSIIGSGGELAVIDRNYGVEDLEFPEEYRPYAMPPVPHAVLQKIHKLFRWSLNFNSIKASPTMCAMRVYELQAQGKGIISNYARSIFNKFPEIRIVAEKEDLAGYFSEAPSLEELRNNETQIRNVLTSCTAQDIAGRIASAIGVPAPGHGRIARVALVASRLDDQLRRDAAAQKHVDVDVFDRTAQDVTASMLGSYDYVGFLDPTITYGPHYAIDRVNAFKYTDSVFVTQASRWDGRALIGPAHEFVTQSRPNLSLYSVHKLGTDGIDELLRSEHDELHAHGYAVPPFEAHERDEAGSDPGGAVSGAPAPAETSAAGPVLSIIVPVYNAGKYLTTKCLPSIFRNRRCDEFEIILVDDGSTDGVTPEICRGLARQHERITAFCFDDGGSGSASRPRNKGIEMARGALIAFLDPDNEISDGGYDVLLDLLEEARATTPGVAFVSGYQVKVTEKTGTTGRHTSDRLTVVEDLRGRFFERGRFPVVSTQAAVIDRALFEDGTFRFVERAAGQDTLFGWELMLKSEAGAFTSAAHLIYYAERDGSVTNSVDAKYFEKKLIMETAQVEALRDYGLLELYRDHHFDNFYNNWYVPKLDHVRPEDRPRAEAVVRQIHDLYRAG